MLQFCDKTQLQISDRIPTQTVANFCPQISNKWGFSTSYFAFFDQNVFIEDLSTNLFREPKI